MAFQIDLNRRLGWLLRVRDILKLVVDDGICSLELEIGHKSLHLINPSGKSTGPKTTNQS